VIKYSFSKWKYISTKNIRLLLWKILEKPKRAFRRS